MSNLLVARDVCKTYGNYTALNNLSLEIPKGSIFGLLGPNGAGKTTFIRIINQITMPDKGSITFNGEALQQKHIAHIGYLPEERGLYKSMKVGEQALYLAQLKGLSKLEAKRKLNEWFERLEICDWWNKKIQELSKGMAQKVQFIVTVLHEPSLLIFDEPFSGFDPVNANLIKDEILALRDKGATIVFSTHRMESVEELCDNIALIHQSNKILDGELSQIKRNFKSNTFELGIEAQDKEYFNEQLAANYEVEPAYFKSIYDDVKLQVKLKEHQSTNQLLNEVSSRGRINHFKEVIPSVNDIFIQSVTNHE
ncbi:ABC transporter ATP-binding protein [Gangjinia marincola]|uniref:ABC transporter ATP-binding protein n=1 Tax=Gangjinia marincola TaxID=578463 RepID=A0ABN1MDW1_9FLAO